MTGASGMVLDYLIDAWLQGPGKTLLRQHSLSDCRRSIRENLESKVLQIIVTGAEGNLIISIQPTPVPRRRRVGAGDAAVKNQSRQRISVEAGC
jgi:hypothetical protein